MTSDHLFSILDFKTIDAKIVALTCSGQFVDRVDQGSFCGLLLDKTNFYAEAGGQAADQGLAVMDKVKLLYWLLKIWLLN